MMIMVIMTIIVIISNQHQHHVIIIIIITIIIIIIIIIIMFTSSPSSSSFSRYTPNMVSKTDPGVSLSPTNCVKEVIESAILNAICNSNSYWAEL